ncbi:DNA topoisomerase I, partial [Chlamydia psittaci 84-8471/1]
PRAHHQLLHSYQSADKLLALM